MVATKKVTCTKCKKKSEIMAAPSQADHDTEWMCAQPDGKGELCGQHNIRKAGG